MSWLFGLSKKKEQPRVTVDPTPIDGFVMVNSNVMRKNSDNLYPDISNLDIQSVRPSNLPYTTNPTAGSSCSSRFQTSTQISNEVQNQLEAVPFRLSSQLKFDGGDRIANDLRLSDYEERIKRLKRSFNSGDFDYDFKLENRILREANMINGHSVY